MRTADLVAAPPPDRIVRWHHNRPGSRGDSGTGRGTTRRTRRRSSSSRVLCRSPDHPELRDGHPIWCIGRAIEEPVSATPPVDLDGKVRRARPKYLALPGEKPVLGLEHVVGRQAVYLVEGPLDWLAGIAWGL